MLPRPHQWPTVWSLLRHPSLPRERILQFRDQRLQRLVAHAYQHVPYFRSLFDRSGIGPGDIRGAADLPKIPITSKLDLQTLAMDEVLATGTDRTSLVERATSGSLGIPFTIRRGKSEDDLIRVAVTRTAVYHGYRPTLKHASVVFPRPGGKETLAGRVLRAMKLFRFQPIDCRLPPDEILSILREHRPDFISGYSGTLARVARLVEGDEEALRPRAVVVGSEVLTPTMREQIGRGFHAPVYDTYGSHEFGRIAYQCRETENFHLCDDTVVVEIVADGRPAEIGERGEVVATGLHSYSMPFIRYRLGDIVTRGPDSCPCGQPFATIREVQGRMVDFFSFREGREMHPYQLMGTIRDAIDDWWIQEYQLVQTCEEEILLKAVPFRQPSAAQVARIRKAAGSILPPGVEFIVEVVGEIPLTEGGKFRTYRSYVDSAHDRTPGTSAESAGTI